MTAMALPAEVEPAAFSPSNAAAYVGFSQSSLATRRYRGMGPRFIKKGGRILYLKSDLDEWLLSSDD